MIEVKIEEYETTVRVKCQGHADYAEKGKDIVCAAVSALVSTWDEFCERMGMKFIKEDMKPGNCEILVYDPYGKLADGIEFLDTGLNLIANTYPQYVSVGRIKY